MKLGIFSWYGFELPLVERLRAVRYAGFETVMLWWEDKEMADEAGCEAVVEAVSDIGLEIENVHLPFGGNDLWSEDEEAREEFVEAYVSRLRACGAAGIPMAVMHVTSGIEIEGPNRYGLEAMTRIAEAAARARVTLAIENTRKPECVEFLLENIRSDRFGLCYDTSHGRLYEPHAFSLLERFPDRVACFHVSDNDGEADRHWIPGRGVVDWDGFASRFPPLYRRGSLSLEVYPERGDIEPETHLTDAFAALQSLRDRIEAARGRERQ
ncbi:MAG: sugar phosphate isomerase/epimerase [Spirochaetales bacterium]|nr:sugar phosphate isomerase/epimerase [Spirochaetales bacterium]